MMELSYANFAIGAKDKETLFLNFFTQCTRDANKCATVSKCNKIQRENSANCANGDKGKVYAKRLNCAKCMQFYHQSYDLWFA